jgi:hypothetical protein
MRQMKGVEEALSAALNTQGQVLQKARAKSDTELLTRQLRVAASICFRLAQCAEHSLHDVVRPRSRASAAPQRLKGTPLWCLRRRADQSTAVLRGGAEARPCA